MIGPCGRWLLLGVSIAILGAGFVAAAEPPQTSDETLQVRVFELKHLDTKDAQLVIRTIYEARRVAELIDRSLIIVADTPARLDAIGKLLERIDIPPAKGRAAAERALEQTSTVDGAADR